MKIKDFKFNLREAAGSMGDLGILFPLAIGYIVVCGLNPAGFLVMMGLANIVTGIVYRLPMPIEPMKVLAPVAITQQWAPSMVYASGFGTGIIWLFMAVTGLIDKLARITPTVVVRGIQLALGILLALEGYKMIDGSWFSWILAGVSIIILTLRQNKYAPAAIVLMALGICVVAFKGQLFDQIQIKFTPPPITLFSVKEIWDAMVQGGFAQVPLTATNAVIATSALITQYWPDKPVPERKLALNMGIMNVVVPFFGGMPMCHGAGGLAGQYYYGARTGGTNLIEGTIEIFLGLFLAGSIAGLFSVFPMSIVGAMMFLVGIELTKFARDIKWKETFLLLFTALLSVFTNMAIGFIAGILIYHAVKKWGKGVKCLSWIIGA
jgi:hypothetical protein